MLSRGESGPAHLGGSYGEGNRHTDQLLNGALSTQRPRRPSLNSTCTRSPPRTILRGLLLREVAPTCFLCVAAACCSVRALATPSVCPLFFQGFLLSPRDCSFNTMSSEEKYQKVLYSLMSPGTVSFAWDFSSCADIRRQAACRKGPCALHVDRDTGCDRNYKDTRQLSSRAQTFRTRRETVDPGRAPSRGAR